MDNKITLHLNVHHKTFHFFRLAEACQTEYLTHHKIVRLRFYRSSSSDEYVFDLCHWGAEAGISHDTASKYRSYKLQQGTVNGISLPRENISHQVKYERSPVLCIAPRLGVVIKKNCMFFGRLGVEISWDRIADKNSDGTDETKSKNSKNRIAFVPGVGVEMALNQKWLARLQYEYSLGSKITHTYKEDNGTASVPVSYDPHAVKVGLSYRFG